MELYATTPVDTKRGDVDVNPTLGSIGRTLHAIASSELAMWLGLTLVVAAVPLFFIKHALLADPDIWWHMRTGEWILQHHAVPHVDPFSWTTVGRPWVNYSWIFDVGSYWIVSHFDLTSIIWLQAIMRVALAAVLFSLLRRITPSFWKAVGLTALVTLAMLWVLQPRPGTVTILFFVIELHILISARKNPRLLWILPAIFLFWVNIHVEFVMGLFVLGVVCLEPVLDWLFGTTPDRKTSLDLFQPKLWPVFAASSIAVLVNPFGYKLIGDVLQLASDTKIFNLITEFHAMHFRTYNDWAVLALLMLGCFAFGRIRPFRPVWALLLAWSAWMSFRSLREVWLVAILCAIVAATVGEEHKTQPAKKLTLSLRIAVPVSVFVLLLAGASLWPFPPKLIVQQVAAQYPVGAAAYIRQNHLQGPLLNELSWGGFLIYAVPGVPVSMDGRTNVHTQDEILDAVPLWTGAAGWQSRPELERANLVISNHSWPLALMLRSDSRFRVAYEDDTAVLFEAVHPQSGENRTVPQTP